MMNLFLRVTIIMQKANQYLAHLALVILFLHFRFSELFSAAIRENGTLCLSIFRLLEEDIDNDGDIDQVLI